MCLHVCTFAWDHLPREKNEPRSTLGLRKPVFKPTKYPRKYPGKVREDKSLVALRIYPEIHVNLFSLCVLEEISN